MAAPRADSYTAASGATVRAGRTSTGWPSWRSSMEARTWKVVPVANTFASIDPGLRADLNPNYPGSAPWTGAGGHAAMLDAWCSLTPSQDDGWVIAGPGGGHGDGASNAQARINLLAESPAWELLSAPSGALPGAAITYSDGQEATGLYSDGCIRAMHNYNNLLHIPGTRKVFVANVSAPYYNPVQTAQKSYYLDMDTGAQSLASDYTALSQVSGSGEGGACYDPVRHCVWHIRTAISSNMILKTDLATGVTTKHGYADAWVGGSSRMVYVPGHDVVAHITPIGGGTGLSVWSPATETWWRKATVTGAPSAGLVGGVQCGGQAGGDWVPALGAIAIWNNDAPYSAEFSLLTPPASSPMTNAWTWSVLSPSAANTVTPPARVGGSGGSANIFGRLRYLPALKGFFLQTQASALMHFFATE